MATQKGSAWFGGLITIRPLAEDHIKWVCREIDEYIDRSLRFALDLARRWTESTQMRQNKWVFQHVFDKVKAGIDSNPEWLINTLDPA